MTRIEAAAVAAVRKSRIAKRFLLFAFCFLLFDVPVAVAVAVDLDVKSAWDAAADAVPKSDQKRNMSEVKQGFREGCLAPAPRYPLASGYAPCKGSEFVSFPDFGAAAAGTRRAAACGRLLLLPFLGETRKGSSSRATPGNTPRSNSHANKQQTRMNFRSKPAKATGEKECDDNATGLPLSSLLRSGSIGLRNRNYSRKQWSMLRK
jgi:hypothetical protein